MKKSKLIICVVIIFIIAIMIFVGVCSIKRNDIEQSFQKNNNMVIKKDSIKLAEKSKNIISDTKNENVLQENSVINNEQTENPDRINNEEKYIDNVKVNNEVQEQKNFQDEKTNIIEEKDNQVEYIEGFEVVGNIKIPKNNVDAPIFKNTNKRTLELSIAVAYGNLNEIGNTTIFGHAYQNMPFEKISNLENGDIIIIKDFKNREITYKVFDKQIISSQDATYMMRETNGTREISMQTGAADNNNLIVLAREISEN